MDAITYGSLFLILGSTRLSVLTCCISENPGKHGFLSADAETQEELKDYLLYEEDGHIGLFVMLGEAIKPLFYGTVTCMEVKAQGGRCVLHLEALTESYQMDLTVRNRSFQDVAMTSHQLIQKILDPYSQSQILFSIEDKALGQIMHLIGVALNGNVVNVSGTKVQVAMAIDGNSRKRALYWFPYSTLSASSDGSGWYCMPEVGDDVRIYFPSKAESEAIALSAVSNYDAPQSGEDRMSDPDNRYLRTKSGQELALAPGYIKLSCGKAASAVTIQTDGKVKIQSQSMVKAMAQEEIAIHAEEQVTLHVSEQFIMHSLSGGQIVSSKGNVIMQGTEVIVD